jgi:3-oxoacyl-[acyl-carrier-protein] synthase II
MKSRIAITGMGVVSPFGKGIKAFSEAALACTMPVAPIPEHWDLFWKPKSNWLVPLASHCLDSSVLNTVECKHVDSAVVLALESAHEAFEMSGLNDGSPNGCVSYGTGCGGMISLMRNHINHLPGARTSFAKAPPERFNPFVVSMVMLNSASGFIAQKFHVHGPCRTFTSSCASSTVAIGNGCRALQKGEADWCITGGAEYLIDETGCLFHGFDVASTLTRIQDPAKCNRPFDKGRNGFLFSSGGSASLILETETHARARGAEILAWVDGFGESCDAYSAMAPLQNGCFARKCVQLALEDARIPSERIDAINAHGTGTIANDTVEGALIRDLFPHRPLVTTTKALVGHLLGGSGAVETVASVLALRDQVVHGMPNLEDPEFDLNFPRCAVRSPLKRVAKFSFGFGGHNAALVLSHKDTTP